MVSSFVDRSYHSAVIASIKTLSFLLSFILKILVCGIVPGFCKSGHKYVISMVYVSKHDQYRFDYQYW